jgi:hypothetical protein
VTVFSRRHPAGGDEEEDMDWTRTDAVRRGIVVAGLIIGPVLLVLSIVINLAPAGESMRADFDAMGQRAGLVAAEALLETLGFTIVLAALAGATQALRARGGTLGTLGAVLAILGIIGFSYSNANGFVLAELAQLPDHDAAFDTAGALMSSDIAGIVGTLGTALELLAEVGIVLVICGLVRAHIVRVWVLIPVAVGILINLVIGDMVSTLIADLLLLGTCVWIALRLARTTPRVWLGEPAATFTTAAPTSGPTASAPTASAAG